MQVAIIGHFGGNKTFNDGQTVKTKGLTRALDSYCDVNILRIDTYYWKRRPLLFFGRLLHGIASCKKIIVLPSYKGRKVFFPLLYFSARYLHREVYHDVIGGVLGAELKEHPKWKKYISAFDGNWVESRFLAEQMREAGIQNAVYVPNFKRLTCVREADFPQSYQAPFRFCTFSRVIREKGISDAIHAIGEVNRRAGRQVAALDIYGPIDDAYKDELSLLLKQTPHCTYCGAVHADQSVETLRQYYALLFPTYWKSEGMPGTIIDSLSAGLPVIARRWAYCDEMLTDQVTGYVYPSDQPEALAEKILYAIEHQDEVQAMKRNCLARAGEYSEEQVIQQLVKIAGLKLKKDHI